MNLALTRASKSYTYSSDSKGTQSSYLEEDPKEDSKPNSKPPSSQPKAKRRVKTSSVLEDKATRGGRGGAGVVAEVIEAYKVAFALTDSALKLNLSQPAANALARRAVDRYALPRVLAAVSIEPRHKWISTEFLAKRRVP